MNYSKILTTDIANGDGVRVTIFVSGCRNHCNGCFNKESWDFQYGQPYTFETEEFIIKSLAKPYIAGITLLGGDPFEPENYELLFLCKRIKEEFKDKTIWAFSGYNFEDLKDREIMEYIDVLVDGKFEESLRDLTLKFRGSSNQRIIDVQESLNSNEVKLFYK